MCSSPEVPGRILSLSTHCASRGEDVKVLALFGSQDDKKDEGSWLMMFYLPFKGTGGKKHIGYIQTIIK